MIQFIRHFIASRRARKQADVIRIKYEEQALYYCQTWEWNKDSSALEYLRNN